MPCREVLNEFDSRVYSLFEYHDGKKDNFITIPAGYTYLGQFVSHEIVPPTRQSDDSRRVLPLLDLTSIYGDDKQGLFEEQLAKLSSEALFSDLPRDDETGAPKIPEPRNEDNVIVAQLHLLLMNLHVVLGRVSGESFDKTRKSVIKVFQSIVVFDFLRQLLMPKVFELYFVEGKRLLKLKKDEIPKEFSLAAFRFGHSMVRSRYVGIGGVRSKPLQDLFRRNQPLSDEFKVDWRSFFNAELIFMPLALPPDELAYQTAEQAVIEMLDQNKDLSREGVFQSNNPTGHGSNRSQPANRIDMKIAKAMDEIPNPAHSESCEEAVDIVRANLLAGSREKIQTGQQYLDRLLKKTCRDVDSVFPGFWFAKRDQAVGEELTLQELPLWPYILKEAEITDGASLGYLGSMIVAEVISNSIRECDPGSSIWDKDSGSFFVERLDESEDGHTFRQELSEFAKCHEGEPICMVPSLMYSAIVKTT